MQNGPQRPREVFFRPDDGGYLHSVLASREAMSAVPEIWRRYGASISANQVGKLCRFGFRPQATKVNAKGRVPTYCGRVQASGLPQAAARGTLNALAVEAFNDLLKKHGKRQNVKKPLLD